MNLPTPRFFTSCLFLCILVCSLNSVAQKDTSYILKRFPQSIKRVPPLPGHPARLEATVNFPKIFALTITKVEPAIFTPGITVAVYFQLINRSAQVANGFVRADFEGPGNKAHDVLVIGLQPGQIMAGTIKLQSPPICYTYIVEATFFQTATAGVTTKKPQQITEMAHDLMVLGLSPGIVDNDHDFLDDGLEHHLLEKFRPLFKFSIDEGTEQYAPVSALWYIGHSLAGADFSNSFHTQCQPVSNFNQGSLLIDPKALLTLSDPILNASTLETNRSKTAYHLIASNDAEHGAPWSAVKAARKIGLYGHVVPLVLPNRSAYHRNAIFGCADPGSDKLFYKVEYWQFFGYSYAHHQVLGIAVTDHQSDWTTVQLLIDAQTENIVSIFHYAHGIEMRFDIEPGMTPVPGTGNGGIGKLVGTFSGPNATAFQPSTDIASNSGGAIKDNAYVRLFREDENSPFTHPVVYIENGAHEFWPTESGKVGKGIGPETFFSPLHNGDDTENSYLTDTPPNLGEVGNPLPETNEASVILHYNGFWGCFNLANDPPPGPPLHTEWTYPFNSPYFAALVPFLED